MFECEGAVICEGRQIRHRYAASLEFERRCSLRAFGCMAARDGWHGA